jgi:hypothetical protein
MKRKLIRNLIWLALFGAMTLTDTAARTSRATNLGDPRDLQAKIDNSPAGSVIIIPNGNYTWTSGVTCNKAITIKGESPGGVTITATNLTYEVFDFTEPKTGNLELANIDFVVSVASNNWVYAVRTSPWRADTFRGGGRILMHDCKFDARSWNYSVEWDTNGGVIWNCTFDGGGLNGLSFVCHSMNATWTQKSTMGTDDVDGLCNTYVEERFQARRYRIDESRRQLAYRGASLHV